MNVDLNIYVNEETTAIALIQGFWKVHSDYIQLEDETRENLKQWTKEGHRFYLVEKEGQPVGFAHLGSRGAETDWLEDLYICPECQGQGMGLQVIRRLEDEVKQYSDALYIEAAARNEAAIRLYRRAGYDCLNTITLRKDFEKGKYDTVCTENIYGQQFEIRK